MNAEEQYAELTERMREIERVQDMLDGEYQDGFHHKWNYHISIVRREVPEETINLIEDIMRH